MNSLVALKTVSDDFQVEYEILSPMNNSAIVAPERREVALALQDVATQINLCEDEIAKLSKEIDRLTNHADGLDYTMAVASGVLTGIIDSVFVGEWNFEKAKTKSIENVNNKVMGM